MVIDHRNAPTSNESNKNIVTWPDTSNKTRYDNTVRKRSRWIILCPKCYAPDVDSMKSLLSRKRCLGAANTGKRGVVHAVVTLGKLSKTDFVLISCILFLSMI
jgi:hypothetical protein